MSLSSASRNQLERKLVGTPVPPVHLALSVDDHMIVRPAAEFFGKGRAYVAGAPGAYTPICSLKHIPNLIENADRLKAAGVDGLFCIVTSDPFSLAAWSRIVDPLGKIRFLSDGNLQFARTLGITSREDSLFLGERSMRYALTVRDGIIQSARIECSVLDFSCTSVESTVELV